MKSLALHAAGVALLHVSTSDNRGGSMRSEYRRIAAVVRSTQNGDAAATWQDP